MLEPRVQGAWNLHNVLLASKIKLDFFVLLSSASGILGNPGQSAYAASNTFLDAFARYRRNIQLPASSIDLGLVEGIGYVSRNLPSNMTLEAVVHNPIKEVELHAIVKAAIADNNPDCDYTQTITGLKLDSEKPLPFWAQDPKMSELLPACSEITSNSSGKRNTSIAENLKHCFSKDEAVQVICEALVIRISAISLTPKEDIDVHRNMDAYGMDSLVAVEIRNWIVSEMDVNLSILDFMKVTNVFQLSQLVAGKTRFVGHLSEISS